MDETHKKHIYQCLPVTYANVYGWELALQCDVVVEWDGGPNGPKILEGEDFVVDNAPRKIANGGIVGMVSFHIGYTFATEPGYEIAIGGSPNYFVDGAHPLSAIVPSSWWPDEFQMSWKISKINEPIKFEAGMPFMFFTVFDSSVLENVKIETNSLWDNKELIESRMKYNDKKMKNQQENPWTWTKGIKTGLDADGNRIGPAFTGFPKLHIPESR
jgi:hypothetical protein